MRDLIFIYGHDNMLQDVKQEASHLAVRKRDKLGNSEDNDRNSYFDLLAFDEGYLSKFRELFFDAQADVTQAISAHMKEVPLQPGYLELHDFSQDRDYIVKLAMPDDFNPHLAKPVDIKIRQFIIAYIMYRWLETKLPEEAAIYIERAAKVKDDIKKMLDTHAKPVRRWHGYW
ncbi:hypothetical protein FACS1894181_13200 [Bacteroidia bacterium]|nr:hypothetical protein FACS1894181_13200 [Bacteroidia bacterium]